jgi:hypothetical protein
VLALPIYRRADHPVKTKFDAFTMPCQARAAGDISHALSVRECSPLSTT